MIKNDVFIVSIILILYTFLCIIFFSFHMKILIEYDFYDFAIMIMLEFKLDIFNAFDCDIIFSNVLINILLCYVMRDCFNNTFLIVML